MLYEHDYANLTLLKPDTVSGLSDDGCESSNDRPRRIRDIRPKLI